MNTLKSFSIVGLASFALLGAACLGAEPIDVDDEDTSSIEEGAKQQCGGILAVACPEGYTCVDDRSDSCDPQNGGADCGGVCVRAKKKANCGGGAGQDYISHDPAQCAAITFLCVEGMVPFFNDCGCGCEPAEEVGTQCGALVCPAGTWGCNCACANAACVPEGIFCAAVCM